MSEKMDPSRVNSIPELNLRSSSEHKLPKLHAMGFGELLDTTFSLYRKHFWSFLGMSAGYSPAMLIVLLMFFFDDSAGRSMRVAIWIATIGVFLGISVFVVSGLMFASAEVYLGRRVKTGAVLRQAGHQFSRCFAGALLFGLLAVLVMFFFGILFARILITDLGDTSVIIGGLFIFVSVPFVTGWFVTYWCFFAAAVLVEGKSVSDSLRRRGELMRGTWGRIIGTMFAIFLLHFTIGLICRVALGCLLGLTGFVGVMEFLRIIQWAHLLQLLINESEASLSYMLMFLINLGVDIFTIPIWGIGGTLLYFNQRIRKEGFDIEMMATRSGE